MVTASQENVKNVRRVAEHALMGTWLLNAPVVIRRCIFKVLLVKVNSGTEGFHLE